MTFDKLIYFSLFIPLLTGCSGLGGISAGTTAAPNDARPSGVPVAQGQLNPLNGQTVTGNVLIFFAGTSNYTLRLEGLSLPAESGLVVRVFATPGGQIASLQLRASTGSQNYSMSTSGNGINFTNVYIHSNPNNVDYATAIIQSTQTQQ
jgi:hypothetical protein